MNAEATLTEWIGHEVPLDFWMEEAALGAYGLEGKRATGKCVAIRPSDKLILLKTDNSHLSFVSEEGFVFEWRENPVDGFPVWISTPSHKAWVALRPHLVVE